MTDGQLVITLQILPDLTRHRVLPEGHRAGRVVLRNWMSCALSRQRMSSWSTECSR